jgi:preprotein translocase subunit SecB
MAEIAGLKFINFEIIKVLFDRSDDIVKDGEFEVNIQHITQINNENENLFRAVFIININGKNNSFSLQVQAIGSFEILGKIPKNVKDNYLNISSPSIIYPYVRAYISNITLQSGMNPIIIPPMNFATKPQKEKKEIQKRSIK